MGAAIIVFILLLAVFSGISAVLAHGGASGIVKERMDIMLEMKARLKLISQMLEGKKAYSNKEVGRALDYIRRHAGSNMSRMFPTGSGHKPSEADPMIWKNWDEFEKMARSLNHATDDFRAVLPETGKAGRMKEVRRQYKRLRKVCKECHDKYRL